MICGGLFDIDNKLLRIIDLENETIKDNFWNSSEMNEVIKELKSLKELTNNIVGLKKNIINNIELILLLNDEEIDLYNQLVLELNSFKIELDNLEITLLLNGSFDLNNCILEVHAGAGGTEACDWANMLYRMYERWCEKRNYKIEVLEYQEGEEVGIKTVSFLIKGEYAYGYLKCEKGVHRLVRLSPFDSNNKRHTSFASVEVTPVFENVVDIEINEADLKIDVYRASGAGGQHVNTTDSAVRITHLPTKIVVTCQNERSQIKNKETAMSMLKSKLKLLEIEKKQEELDTIKGQHLNNEFGSQIRSYVLHPYSMIKDHRTNYETSNVDKVLDGDIDKFIEEYLKRGNKL